MKNWKTTLAGLLLGVPAALDAVVEAYSAGYFTGKTGGQLFVSLAVIIILAILKDPTKKNPVLFADGDGDGKVTPDKPPVVETSKKKK